MGEIHLLTRPGSETLLAPELRRIVRELDPALPLYNVRTMTDHVETNLFLRRIPARMFVVLGPLLLVLAAVGIYGVVAYTVAHRTTEIGVRLALGATPRRVVSQVVRESLKVIVAGAVVGWLAVVHGQHPHQPRRTARPWRVRAGAGAAARRRHHGVLDSGTAGGEGGSDARAAPGLERGARGVVRRAQCVGRIPQPRIPPAPSPQPPAPIPDLWRTP